MRQRAFFGGKFLSRDLILMQFQKMVVILLMPMPSMLSPFARLAGSTASELSSRNQIEQHINFIIITYQSVNDRRLSSSEREDNQAIISRNI